MSSDELSRRRAERRRSKHPHIKHTKRTANIQRSDFVSDQGGVAIGVRHYGVHPDDWCYVVAPAVVNSVGAAAATYDADMVGVCDKLAEAIQKALERKLLGPNGGHAVSWPHVWLLIQRYHAICDWTTLHTEMDANGNEWTGVKTHKADELLLIEQAAKRLNIPMLLIITTAAEAHRQPRPAVQFPGDVQVDVTRPSA